MPTIDIQVQRFSVVSQRTFDEVIQRSCLRLSGEQWTVPINLQVTQGDCSK